MIIFCHLLIHHSFGIFSIILLFCPIRAKKDLPVKAAAHNKD
jgi:hypothetical protein